MKPTPKTKRMTFAEFQRRCLEAKARYEGFRNWKAYENSYRRTAPCETGLRAIKAAWLLPCLLISTAFGQLTTNAPIDLCADVHCGDYGVGFYQVLALPAPAGQLSEFSVLAREHQWNGGLGQYLPHVEPTLHLSIYANLASISANGMKDNESPTLFSQDFSTNNGLIYFPLTNAIGPCSDLATNLYLLKVPLNVRVYPGAYFGLWFTPTSSRNWTIPPLYPPNWMLPTTYQACRYHIRTNEAYWFKPLYAVGGYNVSPWTGYFNVPYAVKGNPQLQIVKTASGVDITWGTNDTNLWLTSSQGRLPLPLLGEHGSGVSLPTTNNSQLFWLER